ncbi:MAG: hypothetical protein HQL21_06580 [Candidatus Omnitrophica bacterium]|nr:hypothetical protein [Candidatus Omnitrophota bacterium]
MFCRKNPRNLASQNHHSQITT